MVGDRIVGAVGCSGAMGSQESSGLLGGRGYDAVEVNAEKVAGR